MTKEYEAIGMNVSSDELYDQFLGENPHQWVLQNFSNQDGTFNRELVEYYLQNLNDFPAEIRANWLDFEKGIKENRLETKFNNLVKASYMVPNALAEKYYQNKNTKASADVIALRYAKIADSTIVVTDKDNKAFYEENKYRYETDERRDIEYVVFEVKPSLEDRQDALKYVESMKADFTSTDNVINFVNANSDKRYDSTWMSRKDVPQVVEASVFDMGNGAGFVYGPYEDEGSFNLVRIIDLQSRPSRHVLSEVGNPYAIARLPGTDRLHGCFFGHARSGLPAKSSFGNRRSLGLQPLAVIIAWHCPFVPVQFHPCIIYLAIVFVVGAYGTIGCHTPFLVGDQPCRRSVLILYDDV